MKLAACFTIWNGLELLNGAINQIREDVDVIVLGWQWKSNKGEISQIIEEFLEQYNGDAKVHLMEFVPDFKKTTKENELDKHNLLIDECISLGCSHFLLMAADHYYEPEQFRSAKNKIELQDFTVTFSEMFTYYKHPTWRMDPVESYMMPFILKIEKGTRFMFRGNYPEIVDPAVKIFPIRSPYTFKKSELMLHHFSMIRKDIQNKFNNAAASIRWSPEKIKGFVDEYNKAKPGDHISYFKGRRIIKVKNFFDI